MGGIRARLRECEYCGASFIGRSRYCKPPHRTAASKVRRGLKIHPADVERRLLAHHPELRPEYVPPPVEPHPVALLIERERELRPVDPVWQPWDPLGPV